MKAKVFSFELINWMATHDEIFARMMMGVKLTKVKDYTGVLNFMGANWFIKHIENERPGRSDPKIYTQDGKIIVELEGRDADQVIVIDDIKYFYLIDSFMLLSFIQNKEAMDLFHNRLEVIYGD